MKTEAEYLIEYNKKIVVFPIALIWDLFYDILSIIYKLSTKVDRWIGRQIDEFLED